MCVRGPKQNLLKLLNTPVMSNTVLPHCYGPLKAVDRGSYPLYKLSALLPVHILSSYEECISCIITSGHNVLRFVQSIWSA